MHSTDSTIYKFKFLRSQKACKYIINIKLQFIVMGPLRTKKDAQDSFNVSLFKATAYFTHNHFRLTSVGWFQRHQHSATNQKRTHIWRASPSCKGLIQLFGPLSQIQHCHFVVAICDRCLP